MEAVTAYLLASLTGGNAPVSPAVYYSTSTTLINSSTDALVNGLSAAVMADTTYLVAALVAYVAADAAGTPRFTFHGPTANAVIATDFLDSSAGTVSDARVLNGAFSANQATGPTMTATDTCAYRASGLVTFSAAGTLSLQANSTVGTDTFTCQAGSYISVTALPASAT